MKKYFQYMQRFSRRTLILLGTGVVVVAAGIYGIRALISAEPHIDTLTADATSTGEGPVSALSAAELSTTTPVWGTPLTEGDTGSMVSILEGGYIVVELPAASFKKSALLAEPEGILETAENSPDPSAKGTWTQGFRAIGPGKVTLSASSTLANVRDFTVTVTVSPKAPPMREASERPALAFWKWM